MVNNVKNYNFPDDWEVKYLEEVANVSGGKRLPKGVSLVEEDTGHPYIRVADMDEKGVSLDNILYVPNEVVESIQRYRIYEGDLYISVAGTLGLVGMIPKELDGANLTENADRISGIKTNPYLLKYMLQSDLVQKEISRVKTTSAQPKLALTRIKKFHIPIPPINEQNKIAAILTSVDNTIEQTEAVIEQTEKVKKGLMQQLLTKGIGHTKFKKTEIGEIPEKWEIKKLEQISELKYGKSPKDVKVENSPYPIYGTSGITGYAKKQLFRGPLVLIGRKGTIDKPIYIEEDCWIIDTAYGLFYKEEVNLKWLYYYLDNYKLERLNEATGVPSLSRDNLYNIKLSVPSLDEQKKIVGVIETVDGKSCYEKQRLSRLNTLKKGLMQVLLTGKVRVKVDEEEVSTS